MFALGCHLSAADGFAQLARDAYGINADTFQFFTRNPRGGRAKEISTDDVAEYKRLSKAYGISKVLAHAPYTLNFCSADERIRVFARETLEDDLKRMEYIPGNMYNFHPGSHVGQGIDVGIDEIIETINAVLSDACSTRILLETMSGKGSEVGSKFEELRRIIDGVNIKEKVGVCMDTCHVYDAGYDIKDDLDGVLDEFDKIIGMDMLCAIHLNDTKNPFCSHKDRHEKIGQGYLGADFFGRIINHPALRDLPFYLETPCDYEGYGKEIEMLREMRK